MPQQTICLSDLKRGDQGTVVSVEASYATRLRLLELGLLPGTSLQVVRFAPLGDPMQITLRGYCLSIRREDAKGIQVERTSRGKRVALQVL